MGRKRKNGGLGPSNESARECTDGEYGVFDRVGEEDELPPPESMRNLPVSAMDRSDKGRRASEEVDNGAFRKSERECGVSDELTGSEWGKEVLGFMPSEDKRTVVNYERL
jgi:hypothetical protein